MVAPAQAATSGDQSTRADVVVGPAADGTTVVALDVAVDFGDGRGRGPDVPRPAARRHDPPCCCELICGQLLHGPDDAAGPHPHKDDVAWSW